MDAFHHRCSKCHAARAWGELFAQSTMGYPELRVLVHTCAACGTRDEYQAAAGRLSFGYVYAAGAAHFAAMEDHAVAGLGVVETAGAVQVDYEGRQWRFSTAV